MEKFGFLIEKGSIVFVSFDHEIRARIQSDGQERNMYAPRDQAG